ncbi:MAG: FAD-dependent oxidoreductase [Bryobacterales bacterium]|nr:FAD-dependent oxidoreductase [Bryobacterales bacterium]
MRSTTSFDVAVIGGGIIGLSAAWRLCQQGLSVAIADAGKLAGEASAAGAGMLAPGGEALQTSAWARDTVDARQEYPRFVEELREGSGIEIDFRECGAIDIASDDTAWASLSGRRGVQESMGIEVREIGEAEARRMVPLLRPGSFKALHYPGDAIVDPRAVCAALRLLLARAGARFRENERIARIEADGGGYALLSESSGPVMRTASVVVAAGAWSSQISVPERALATGPAPRKAISIRGHLVQCQRPPGTLAPIVRERHLYVFQRNHGGVISGSNEERVGFDRSPNPEAVKEILLRTGQALPTLFGPESNATSWLGFRPGIEGDGPELRQMEGERSGLPMGTTAMASYWPPTPRPCLHGRSALGKSDRRPIGKEIRARGTAGFEQVRHAAAAAHQVHQQLFEQRLFRLLQPA